MLKKVQEVKKLSLRVISVFLFSLILTGCGSLLSGTGPYSHSITNENAGKNEHLPYTLIDLTPENASLYAKKEMLTDSAKVSMPVSLTIRLMPGDMVKVMISDSAEGSVFSPLASGGNVFNNVRIDASGFIKLPYVGRVKAQGLTLEQLDNLIEKKLKGAVAIDPQAHSELIGDLSGSILVAGAVKAPGRFSSLEGALTILDAINMAGGALLEPHLINIIVRDGRGVYTFNYDDVLKGHNQQLSPRSEVIVERARQRVVTMGSVRSPGLTDLPSRTSSLLEVLGAVGGLDETKADPQGVFVFRVNTNNLGEPTAEVFRLDMRRPESIFIANTFQVFAEDTIYVTNAPVYEWQKIISPIVQSIVLGRIVNGL